MASDISTIMCELITYANGELKQMHVFMQAHNRENAEGYYFQQTLQCRHNERDGVSNHRRLLCWLNRLFWLRSKKTSKVRVTGLCEGKPPVTSNAENVSIWWRHHDIPRIIHISNHLLWVSVVWLPVNFIQRNFDIAVLPKSLYECHKRDEFAL